MIRTALIETFDVDVATKGRQVLHEERTITGPHGDIILSIFKPTTAATKPRPGIYFVHGGGMVMGNRFIGAAWLSEWVELFDAVGVAVEYRLAPEFPYPIPLEDCYAGLKWMGDHLSELGIDPTRLLLAGQSAGAGLSACLALTVRDKGGPKLTGLCLQCPMLDDRNNSLSAKQFSTGGTWDQAKNRFGWTSLLGEQTGKEGVSQYASASRATDLSGLPPTFLDVGSAEPFRDETVAFANGIWKAGGQADLHVWAGAYHGFEMVAPAAKISVSATRARNEWVAGILG
jgi:acetyl esterase/lipase